MNTDHKVFLNQSFHDVPVIGMKMNFEETTIDLFIALHNEEIDDYDYFHLIFYKVRNLKVDPFALDFDNDTMVEINTSDFKEVNGSFQMYFLFLLGWAKPSMEMKFDFGEFSLVKAAGEEF